MKIAGLLPLLLCAGCFSSPAPPTPREPLLARPVALPTPVVPQSVPAPPLATPTPALVPASSSSSPLFLPTLAPFVDNSPTADDMKWVSDVDGCYSTAGTYVSSEIPTQAQADLFFNSSRAALVQFDKLTQPPRFAEAQAPFRSSFTELIAASDAVEEAAKTNSRAPLALCHQHVQNAIVLCKQGYAAVQRKGS